MGVKYLIDTNAVIELLGGTLPTSGINCLQHIIDQNDYYLSVINQIELLGYNGSPTEMQTLEDFRQTVIINYPIYLCLFPLDFIEKPHRSSLWLRFSILSNEKILC